MKNDEIKSVWSECAGEIKKAHLSEVKSFANPPVVVGQICTALIMVFEDKKVEQKNAWSKFKKMAADPNFISSLVHYDIQKFDKTKLPAIKKFLKENGLGQQEDNGRVAAVSFAMKHAHQWLLNLMEEVEKHAELDQEIAKNEEFQKLWWI